MDDEKVAEVGRRVFEILAEAQLAPGREQDAVHAIAELGTGTAAALTEAIDLLDGRGRRIAALALAAIDESDGWPVLARLVREGSLELRGDLPTLLRAIGRLCPRGDEEACAALLASHGSNTDPLVRAAVADAFFHLPGRLGALPLQRLRADPDPFVRDRAQAALVGGGDEEEGEPRSPCPAGQAEPSDEGVPRDVQLLLGRLVSFDEAERRAARAAFASHDARLRILEAFGTGPAIPLRRSLLEALGEHPAPDCRDFIAAALDRMDMYAEDHVLLLRAAAQQRMCHPAFALEQARRHLHNPDLFVRAELAGLLALCRGAPLDALPSLLRDREFHVREKAARAWHAAADRTRARIVPDILDLVEEVLAQPRLYREDVILLTILLAGMVRIIRDGGFVEERIARIAAQALSSELPPLRRQGAALLRAAGRDDGAAIDPAAYAPVSRLLLSESEEDAELAIELLERATPPSVDRSLDAITRFVYRATDAQLLRLLPVLASTGTPRCRGLLQRLVRHPDERVAEAARSLLEPAGGEP